MSRGMVLTCALLAGVGVVGFHAAEPDCEGWYCLRSAEEPVLQQSVVTDGEPNNAQQAVAKKAKPAGGAVQVFVNPDPEPTVWPDDLEAPTSSSAEPSIPVKRAVRPVQSGNTSSHVGFVEEDDLDEGNEEVMTPAQWRAAKIEAKKAADAWEALTLTALQEADPAMRAQAISDVGNYRNDEAVGVLLEVAALERESENRIQALESLWYSAADGLDSDGSIRNTLMAALSDPDEQVAEMAERAIADLDALEAAE